MARMTITVPTAKILDSALGGKPDAQLKAWFDFAKGQRNVDAATYADIGKSVLTVNSEDSSTSAVLLALSKGGDVEGAPMFIKMTSSKYQQQVPVGIHERTYMDPEGNELNRKWSEWKSANHEHMDATDGDKIVPGNSWGVELSSAELKSLIALTGYTLVLGHEVKALLPEPEGV